MTRRLEDVNIMSGVYQGLVNGAVGDSPDMLE